MGGLLAKESSSIMSENLNKLQEAQEAMQKRKLNMIEQQRSSP